MNYIMSTICELINLLDIDESSLIKEKKHVMLVDVPVLRKVPRIRREINPLRLREMWQRKRLKRLHLKGVASIVVKLAIGKGTARPT